MPLPFGGPLAEHMAIHITLMSLAALLAAYAVRGMAPRLAEFPGHNWLGAATLAQMALLWAWHAPAVLGWALSSPAAHGLMQASLLLSAFWFWMAVLNAARLGPWRAIVALLITGKVFCLLGILLVFAPRVLYPAVANVHHHDAGLSYGSALADQQLAGLLMVIACPLTYVLAGVVLAARWIAALDRDPAQPLPCAEGPVAQR